jgi:serine protease AprX
MTPGLGGPSTSWGSRSRGHAARLTIGALGLAAAVAPLSVGSAFAAPTRHSAIVSGPAAATAVRSAHGSNVRTAGYADLAVADLTDAQQRDLSARGLHVVRDAPVQLDYAHDHGHASGRGAADDGNGANDPESATRLSARQLTVPSSWDGEGSGVTVAVVDSGVDEVPALAGRVVQGANFTDESSADLDGHGTFDAGLIAGDGTGTEGTDTGIVGVAPGARIVSVKVADHHGRSTVGQVALGLAWIIKHHAAYGIDVVNLSLSTSTPMSYDVNPVNALVEAAWFAGMTVVASSGNGGADSVNTAPGNDPFIITAGSVYDHNTRTSQDDTISPYTNVGRTIDGFSKPELMEPGEHLQGPLPEGSALAADQTVHGLPAGYGQLSGTSMAAAVTSGLVALFREAHPSASPDQVKGALLKSATRNGAARLARTGRATSRTANTGVRPSMALASAYAQLFRGTNDYSSIDWDAVDWSQVAWDQATWTDVNWTAATWASATWADATWADATWADATWATATWANASWTDASWTDASWTDASWTDASWTDATADGS